MNFCCSNYSDIVVLADSLLARATYTAIATCICTYGNAYTTKVQIKTRLASTVQANVQPVSSLAALEVLRIGEATVSVANGYKEVTRYCYSKLAIDNRFSGGVEDGELFSCPPRTGSSRYPLLSFLCSCLYAQSLLYHIHCDRMHMCIRVF